MNFISVSKLFKIQTYREKKIEAKFILKSIKKKLGGRKCECIPMQQLAHTPKNAKEFCSIFCIHYNTSINGCSKCSLNVPKSSGKVNYHPLYTHTHIHACIHTSFINGLFEFVFVVQDFPSTSDSTTTSIADAHFNETESIANTTNTTTAVAAAELTEIPTTLTTITEQTETAITTISSATSAGPMEHDSSSTTPDWHMVCVDLCKKGEGGVLCNCDLPPLLFKRN